MSDNTLIQEHDKLILETKNKMDLARAKRQWKAFNDLKKYYDRLLIQRKTYLLGKNENGRK